MPAADGKAPRSVRDHRPRLCGTSRYGGGRALFCRGMVVCRAGSEETWEGKGKRRRHGARFLLRSARSMEAFLPPAFGAGKGLCSCRRRAGLRAERAEGAEQIRPPGGKRNGKPNNINNFNSYNKNGKIFPERRYFLRFKLTLKFVFISVLFNGGCRSRKAKASRGKASFRQHRKKRKGGASACAKRALIFDKGTGFATADSGQGY